MTKLTVLSVAAAVLGKAMTSDDEALVELNALGPQIKELTQLRELREILAAEFENEKDPAKLTVKVRELKAKVTQAEHAAAEQRKTAIETQVTTTIKQYEKAIGSVPLRTLLSNSLKTELESGKKLDDTETMKTLKSLAPNAKFSQESAGDLGGKTGVTSGDDEKYSALVEEKLKTDDECKELARTNRFAARNLAHEKVDEELAAAAAR